MSFQMIEPIQDWKNIDGAKAIALIEEILGNLTNDSLILVNANVLEKKFSKASGTVSDWIFYDDISDPEEILKLLKESTTLLL